jgi:hypothetical protein
MPALLRKPHEYHVDRGTRQAIMDRVNPTREFRIGEWERDYPPPAGAAKNPGEPHGPIIAQKHEDGVHFFSSTGREIPPTEVPDYIHETLLRDPLRLAGETPEQVLKFCPYCPETDNAVGSAFWESHLLAHLRRAGLQPIARAERPGPQPDEPEPTAPPAARRRGRPPKRRPETVSLEA